MSDERGRTDDVTALAALGDPSRRALYDFIVHATRAVSREKAAAAVGLERGTATHHLERLAADGLLKVEYRRLTGRQGPGAGRPAKLYRRADRQFDVTLPRRDYALVSRLLATATDRARGEGMDIEAALHETCTKEGQTLAARILGGLPRTAGPSAKHAALRVALGALGYEPAVVKDRTIVLRNCPFHQLSREHSDLVCGLNRCLVHAAVEDLQAGLTAQLQPEEGFCCVRIRPAV